jgi:hypothetical protein
MPTNLPSLTSIDEGPGLQAGPLCRGADQPYREKGVDNPLAGAIQQFRRRVDPGDLIDRRAINGRFSPEPIPISSTDRGLAIASGPTISHRQIK